MSEVSNNPDILCQQFSLPTGLANILGWICTRCELCHNDKHKLCLQLEEDISSEDIITTTCARVLHDMVEKVRSEGITFTREVHTDFN